jgi:hypothetical protein
MEDDTMNETLELEIQATEVLVVADEQLLPEPTALPEHVYRFTFGKLKVAMPWHPTTYQTTVVDGVERTQPVQPAYINNLQDLCTKRPRDRKLATSFKNSAAREGMIKIQPAADVHCVQGNIVLCSTLPEYAMAADDEFIYVSDKYIERNKVKWDFDGDTLALGFDPTTAPGSFVINGMPCAGRWVVPIKNPITRQITPAVLTDTSVLRREPMWDFTHDERAAWMQTARALDAKEAKSRAAEGWTDKDAIWYKSNNVPPVGLLDGKVKNWFLFQLQGLPLTTKQDRFYEGDVAFEVLEMNALGAVRKDHDIRTDQSHEIMAMIDEWNTRVPSSMAPFLTRTGRIGSMATRDLEWFWAMDLREHIKKVVNLDIPFWVTPERPDPTRAVIPPVRTTLEHNLIHKLRDFGVLKFQPIARRLHPAHDTGIPNPVLVSLYNLKGKPVALTDVRRAQGVVEGPTYKFILPPVWDAENQKWVSPEDHMARMAHLIIEHTPEGEEILQGFDARILDPTRDLAFASWWGAKSIFQIFENKHAYKLTAFQKWLSAYVGRYGLVVPGVVEGQVTTLPTFNMQYAANTAVVDYGLEPKELVQRRAAFELIPEYLCPSTKGDDQRVKKHALNAVVGGRHPWHAPTTCNARRAGQALSQLTRVHVPNISMLVAITLPNPLLGAVDPADMGQPNQVQITEHGIQKQLLSNSVLGRTVFGQRLTHVPHPEFTERQEYETLTGQTRVSWARSPKGSKRVGKLIDGLGGKFMPMPTIGFNQAWLTSTKMQIVPLEYGAEFQLLMGYDHQPDGPPKPRYNTVSISPEADLNSDMILVVDGEGITRKISRNMLLTEQPVEVRHYIDLFYPAQELLEKGLLEHYMQDAVQAVVNRGDGTSVVCWITFMKLHRTSTPTENMKVRHVRRRVRGTDAHMVVSAMRKARFDYSQQLIDTPNLERVETIKEQALNVLRLLGHGEIVPQDNDLRYQDAEPETSSVQHLVAAARNL